MMSKFSFLIFSNDHSELVVYEVKEKNPGLGERSSRFLSIFNELTKS